MTRFGYRFRISVVASAVVLAAAAASAGGGRAAEPARAGDAPEFTLRPDRVLVPRLGGYGGQFNQHVYAEISGPPPDLGGFEAKLLALQPQFVRVFFNTNSWTYPDRMRSFVRAVGLAQRTGAEIDVTWQGSSLAFARANMSRFADALADVLERDGVPALWVTLFNEPNSTRLTLPQYESVYRLLDDAVRARGIRQRVHFMGGDLVGTTSPLGQEQDAWLAYMASHMGDLLDAWSIHVFWDYWDTGKIERRLAEVRAIRDALPTEQRRPLYVTEYGVRGIRSFAGEPVPQPGAWADGTPVAQTNLAALQEAWFVIRAAQLGYVAALKWDLYNATYDNTPQDYSLVGPGTAGWPLRPMYHLLRLMTLTTKPGWQVVDVEPSAAASPVKLLAGYLSPAGNVTVLGIDTDGAHDFAPHDPVTYDIGGLPPNMLFRLVFWNGDGSATNVDIGFLDSGAAGRIRFDVPTDAVFAATSYPVELG